MQTVHINETNQGLRTDAFVTANFKVHSRSFLKHNWERLISINGKPGKPSYKLRKGDVLEILDEEVNKLLEEHSYGEIIPQHHTLDIKYEDKDFLIINKSKNLVVHPGVGNPRDTLVNYVVEYLQSKDEYDPRVERGGIVHRLDKPVSGLILFAKNSESQLYFQKQFEEHNVEKIYLAKAEYGNNLSGELREKFPTKPLDVSEELDKLIQNNFEIDDTWLKVEGNIGRSSINRMKMTFKTYSFNHGRAALSYIKPVSENEFLVIIKTGRMHQIRATMEYLGANILGDTLYKTLKGGAAPDEIALESILLCCNDMQGKRLINRLK